MKHELPALSYAYNALEPHFDKQTMEIHHTRHHQAYVDNLNKALTDIPEADQSLLEIFKQVSKLSPAIRNNGGGHYNHTLFWNILSATPTARPSGSLAAAIDQQWGSLEQFKEQFNNLAMTRFGSGWAWLYVKYNGQIAIASSPNQDNPLMDINTTDRGIPILGIDVWEHAYYLNYQNKRADYIKAFWEVLDWKAVEKNYETAIEDLH